MVEEESKKSVYNEGVMQIHRLNNSWVKCNYYATHGLFDKWKWELDVIFRELASDIFRLGKDKTIEDFETNKMVEKINNLNDQIKGDVSRVDLYKVLNEKDIYLRLLQFKSGKGGRYEDEDSYSLED